MEPARNCEVGVTLAPLTFYDPEMICVERDILKIYSFFI
jgi:hypothetical protein